MADHIIQPMVNRAGVARAPAAHSMTVGRRRPRSLVALLVLLVAASLGAHALSRPHGPSVHTIVVGGLPDALALDSRTGRAFVADDAAATVSVLDLATHRVLRTVAVGPADARAPLVLLLALAQRSHRLVTVTPWDTRSASVIRLLDSRDGTPLTTVRVAPRAIALAVDERAGHALVATGGAGRVSLLDARTGRLLRTTRVGLAPVAVAVDARIARAFVLGTALRPPQEVVGGQAGLVGVLDTRSGALVRTVVVGHVPEAIAVDARTARVFVANSGDDTVSVLDAQTGTMLHTVRVGGAPSALAVDARHGRVFVATADGGRLSMLDARSGRLLRTRVLFPAVAASGVPLPSALTVDEERARVYLTAWGPLDHAGVQVRSGQLAVLDARSGRLLRRLAVGVTPQAVAVAAGSGRVVVVNSGGALRVAPGWVERWAGQVAGWAPWLGRLIPRAPEVVLVPGSVQVIDPDAEA